MHRVIKFFTDLQDNNYPYHEGDTFPREGVTVTADRIKELASKKNKRGIPLIEEVKGEAIPFAEGEPYPAEVEEPKEEKKKVPTKARSSKKKG